MSQALWCDLGQHAFSANDPERGTIELGRMVKNEYGSAQMHRVPSDVCGTHINDFKVTTRSAAEVEETARKAIESAKDIEASEIELAKSEAAMWRAKYEAEREKP